MRNAQEFSKLGANIKILCNVSSQVHGRLKVKGYFVKTWKSALCKAYFKRTEKKKTHHTNNFWPMDQLFCCLINSLIQ